MALKGKQALHASIAPDKLKTNASAADAGKIMVFDANNALSIYDPLVFGASDVTMTGDVIVTGDLNINGGDLTSLDTVDVSLKDNIISVASSAISAADGGFQLNKSAGGSVSLKWIEADSEWKISLADESTHVIADVAAMEVADDAVEQGIINQNVTSTAAESALAGQISDEGSARLLADQALSGTVNSNTTTLLGALEASEDKLQDEESRSTDSRLNIEGLLTGENERATEAEGVIATSISNEEGRAIAAETQLAEDIVSESTRAEDRETAIGDLIDDEISRAKAKELEIDNKITGQTASRIYDYDSVDFEIRDIRYGDLGDNDGDGLYDSFSFGQHTGAEDLETGLNPEMRTIHADLTLELSDGSTVTTNDNIKSFSAYTENVAKVAESVYDNSRYNEEILRAIVIGEPGNELHNNEVSDFINADGTLNEYPGQLWMDRFDAGNITFDLLKHRIDEVNALSEAREGFHQRYRYETLSYSHSVTHSISSEVSSGILTIPAMSVISSVYNADNISGYWAVSEGGIDVRNWANNGDISVLVNGLQLSEDHVSFTIADKAGTVNGTYAAKAGLSSRASNRLGGAFGELAVQLTGILINIDEVGYSIAPDDEIVVVYDKLRGESVMEGYSPDAEVTECGDATASNYVPNAYNYNNALCQYNFPSFEISNTDELNFRIALPLSTIGDGIYYNSSNHEHLSESFTFYRDAIGELTVEIGTVVDGVLTPISTETITQLPQAGSSPMLTGFAGGAELHAMKTYGQGANVVGLESGRHYMKITGQLSNNPHYSAALMVEMYKNTGQGFANLDISDKYLSFGGEVYNVDFVEGSPDGDLSSGLQVQYESGLSHKSYFPDGIFELGKLYYFSVA